LHDLRSGRSATALDTYQDHGRLHLAQTRENLHSQLVSDYLQARAQHSDPWQVAVLAPRRRDLTDLNQLIREKLIADGSLGRRQIKVQTPDGTVSFRKGEQVIVTRNHHDRQLLNGTRGTVRNVRRDGIVVDLTDGRRILLDKGWLAEGDLDHGYAMTLHKAQGRTVHTSLVLGDDSLSQEGGYVGLSRGTNANHLYLDTETEHALRDCSQHDIATHETPTPATTRALSRSSRQALANELLEPSRLQTSRHHLERDEGLSR
ncbi:MAG: hypothetical protein ABR549_12160, partial [Mycobacteriales bacterium]